MAQFQGAFFFLLVAFTFVVLSNSIPYPYARQVQCSVKDLNISQLEGDWHTLYHKDNLNKKVVTKFNQVKNDTALTSIHEDGKFAQSFNLTQNAYLAGKLENLIDRGSWQMALPTFVLAFEPDQYLTLFHAKLNGSDEWAIYGRGTELSKENYDKAVQGLVCANLVNTDDGKPLLHKL